MELIEIVNVKELEEFSLEYYLMKKEHYLANGNISTYDMLLLKKKQNKLVDAAYNRLPYKDLTDAIKFIEKMSKNKVTPIAFNEILFEDIYATIS